MQAAAQQPQRAPDGAPLHYELRRPELTTLYRLVPQQWVLPLPIAQRLLLAPALVTPVLQLVRVVQRKVTRHQLDLPA